MEEKENKINEKNNEENINYEPKRYYRRPTHYERTRAQVYATGNKWAIENFEATHN